MLRLIVGEEDAWDAVKEEFTTIGGVTLEFDYTLKIVADWESKWRVPWLTMAVPKSPESVYDMYTLMCRTPELLEVRYLTPEIQGYLQEYMNNDQTATTFSHTEEQTDQRIITTEQLYATMSAANIPWEAENWHLGRLLTLIRVINDMSGEKKKMSPKEEFEQRRMLNEQRRAEMNSKG